jgi:hypothetical protein
METLELNKNESCANFTHPFTMPTTFIWTPAHHHPYYKRKMNPFEVGLHQSACETHTISVGLLQKTICRVIFTVDDLDELRILLNTKYTQTDLVTILHFSPLAINAEPRLYTESNLCLLNQVHS